MYDYETEQTTKTCSVNEKTEQITSAVERKKSFSDELEESKPDTSATFDDEYEKLFSKMKEKCKVYG